MILILLVFMFGCPKSPVVNPEPIPEPEPQQLPYTEYIDTLGDRFIYKGEYFNVQGVNYFPIDRNWKQMYSIWQPEAIKSELELVADIGVNVVRIFTFTGSDDELAKLDYILQVIDDNDMKAIVTLFVWSQLEMGDAIIAGKIADRYKDHKAIMAWDVGNELDHRWNLYPHKWSKEYIQSYAEAIASEIRKFDANHLICAGDYGYNVYREANTGKDAENSRTLNSSDFETIHRYGDVESLERAINFFSEKKPLIVGEIGLPTAGYQNGREWEITEDDVQHYVKGWIATCRKHNVGFIYWCAFDYNEQYTHFDKRSTELFFGLWDRFLRLKKNGKVFKALLLGEPLPEMDSGRIYDGVKCERF